MAKNFLFILAFFLSVLSHAEESEFTHFEKGFLHGLALGSTALRVYSKDADHYYRRESMTNSIREAYKKRASKLATTSLKNRLDLLFRFDVFSISNFSDKNDYIAKMVLEQNKAFERISRELEGLARDSQVSNNVEEERGFFEGLDIFLEGLALEPLSLTSNFSYADPAARFFGLRDRMFIALTTEIVKYADRIENPTLSLQLLRNFRYQGPEAAFVGNAQYWRTQLRKLEDSALDLHAQCKEILNGLP